MKTAVETISSARNVSITVAFSRCALTISLIPSPCTPASGWEKGQVENQVGWCGSASLRLACA